MRKKVNVDLRTKEQTYTNIFNYLITYSVILYHEQRDFFIFFKQKIL